MTRLTGRKFEMWSRIFSPGFAQRRAPGRRAHRFVALRVDEVRDHLDRLVLEAELLDGRAAQPVRDGGHGVAILRTAEARGLEVARVVADQRDVGAVQRGDHRQRLRREDLRARIAETAFGTA